MFTDNQADLEQAVESLSGLLGKQPRSPRIIIEDAHTRTEKPIEPETIPELRQQVTDKSVRSLPSLAGIVDLIVHRLTWQLDMRRCEPMQREDLPKDAGPGTRPSEPFSIFSFDLCFLSSLGVSVVFCDNVHHFTPYASEPRAERGDVRRYVSLGRSALPRPRQHRLRLKSSDRATVRRFTTLSLVAPSSFVDVLEPSRGRRALATSSKVSSSLHQLVPRSWLEATYSAHQGTLAQQREQPSSTSTMSYPPPGTAQRSLYPAQGGRPPLPQLPAEYEALARAPSPLLHSPRPTRPPSKIPAGALESQASEVNAAPPYNGAPQPYYRLPSPAPPAHYSPSFQQTPRWSSQPQPGPPPIPPRTPLPQPPSISTVGIPSFAIRDPTPIEPPHQNLPGAFPPSPSYPSLDQVQQGVAQMGFGRRGSAAETGSSSASRPSNGGGPRRGSADGGPSSLALPQPTIKDLAAQRAKASSSNDPGQRVKWARNLLRFLEKTQSGSSIDDPQLVTWVDEAVRVIIVAASAMPPVPEALYLRADLAMSGTFPSLIPKDKKGAFRCARYASC